MIYISIFKYVHFHVFLYIYLQLLDHNKINVHLSMVI